MNIELVPTESERCVWRVDDISTCDKANTNSLFGNTMQEVALRGCSMCGDAL